MSASYLEQLFGLQGKTALCTGSSRGIGAKMAEAVAKAGADVILVQVSCFLSCLPQNQYV